MGDRIARFSLLILEIFLSVTAIWGAIYVVPSLPRASLAGSPFADYTIPSLALGVIVGGGATGAALALLLWPRIGTIVSIAAGASIVIFEIVEIAVVSLDVWLHAVGLRPVVAAETYGSLEGTPALFGIPLVLWLQPLYIVIGALIIGLSLRFRRARLDTGDVRDSQNPRRFATRGIHV